MLITAHMGANVAFVERMRVLMQRSMIWIGIMEEIIDEIYVF